MKKITGNTKKERHTNQAAKERRIIRNANRIRSAPKSVKGSGRLNNREARLKERKDRKQHGNKDS